jgi:hypothetical protein
MADESKKKKQVKPKSGAKRQQPQPRKTAPEDARSMLSGKVKTFEVPIQYQSDFMHGYLTKNERSILNIFERLGAIFRMARTDRASYEKVRDWHYEKNIAIAELQIETIQEQREQLLGEQVFDATNAIKIPDTYKITFELSHPVGNTITQLIKSLDAQLAEIEAVFMNGLIDDLQYEQASRQALAVMSGVVDRIYKVTSPGKREGGAFSVALYMSFLRDPKFDLHSLTDIPRELRATFAGSDTESAPDKSDVESGSNEQLEATA